ncbi:NepR family anti-sigma factor [Plastorhodobacter daqingensis]|uniref:NepR family anti-sigma factor n=1 Tax=Plastorhodobacter daqingensis TaxID=1387281 RepID=A0ABW2UMU3_9RHOB
MPQHDRQPDPKGAAPASQAAMQPDAGASRPRSKDKSVVEQQINENLRRIYQQKLEEAVPDHLQALLERLKEQDRLK